MQVTILKSVTQPSDLFQDVEVLVIPIFVDYQDMALIMFNEEERRRVVDTYLASMSVSFLSYPENLAVLFLSAKKKYREAILDKAEEIYEDAIDDQYKGFTSRHEGLRGVFVSAANCETLSEYMRLPASKQSLIVYTGVPALDKIIRRRIRSGDFDQFSPDALAHPTIRAAFERKIFQIGHDLGFDVEIMAVTRHRSKAFVTCDTLEIEAS